MRAKFEDRCHIRLDCPRHIRCCHAHKSTVRRSVVWSMLDLGPQYPAHRRTYVQTALRHHPNSNRAISTFGTHVSQLPYLNADSFKAYTIWHFYDGHSATLFLKTARTTVIHIISDFTWLSGAKNICTFMEHTW